MTVTGELHEIHATYDESGDTDNTAVCVCGWKTADRNMLIVADRSRQHLIEMNPAAE